MKLRDYQQEAHDLTIDYIKQSTAPCVLELATGAGKSLIVSAIAKTIHETSNGKSVLCIAPSKELVEQNRAKYLLTGNPASMFSAASGTKCLKHPVVFGTPGTIKNSIDKFGDRFSAIILDEAHGITPTIKTIIEYIRAKNGKVSVIGLTATPFRLGSGYIYQVDENNNPVSETQAHNPYFAKLLYKVTAPYLIEKGYLTRPVVGQIGAGGYATKHLEVNRQGKFDSKELDRALVGHGRKTASIVADVVAQSQDRVGVMFFAATIQHAEEIMASLPPQLSDIVTGTTKKSDRERILKSFKARKIKYLVNVAVLTTGFDASHVDVIALLRPTESIGLMQQIIGRGLRLDDDKTDCLILDYAENIERHCPDGDIFAPQIVARVGKEKGELLNVVCPTCGAVNEFSARPNRDGFKIDKDGYFVDLMGNMIETEDGPIPAHYGRRCLNLIPPTMARCDHRWNSKECPHCHADNDIAARYCTDCKGEIINPNEKLRLDFKAMKKDPYQLQIDEVLDYKFKPTVSRSGNPCIRVDFKTPYRNFTIWVQKNPKSAKAAALYGMFNIHQRDIRTVTYSKQSNGFYEVLGLNEPKQELTLHNES